MSLLCGSYQPLPKLELVVTKALRARPMIAEALSG